MTFKWTITRPARVANDDLVSVSSPGVTVEFETGSFKEAHGLFQDEETSIHDIFGDSILSRVDFGTDAAAPAVTEEPVKTRKPRTPKVEAVAPAPLPVPAALAPLAASIPLPTQATAAPVPPVAAAPSADPGDIPEALRRAPPPPLPTAAAPPLAPAAPSGPPPVGVLGPKVVKALDVLREGKPDGGQALADWLNQMGLTIKGATYDQACLAVLMISDEKLKVAAEMLKV